MLLPAFSAGKTDLERIMELEKLEKIYNLMERFSESGLGKLEIREGDFSIKMEMPKPAAYIPHFEPAAGSSNVPVTAAAPELPAVKAVSDGLGYVKSPIVGTFYRAPGQDQEPFVKKGDSVKRGDTLCIVEAMKMMNEIRAPYDCVIENILVSNGAAVGYDEPLFVIREL